MTDLQKRKEKNSSRWRNGKTTEEKEQIRLATAVFNDMFSKEDEEESNHNEPEKMKTPFTKEEISKAVKSLNNGKSAGIDEFKAEMIKYGPIELCQGLAEIFNETAETGIYPLK